MANIATREAYGNALAFYGDKYDITVLDADLSKSTKTDSFKKLFPERFVNCGIAESNMMAVAAGIATTGKIVFASSFAMFAAGRAFEQVRNAIGYPHLNVKIGATHAGLSVGEDGATHQCNEDLGLMNTIPGMFIMSPSDAAATKLSVKAAIDHDGPVYLRLGRLGVPAIYENEDIDVTKAQVLREGTDVTIIATGLMTHEALKACDALKEQGISAEVIDIITVKPIDAQTIIKSVSKTGCVVTAEEHNINGGLGSIVAGVLCTGCPAPMRMVGVEDKYGKSGAVSAVLEEYGLTADNIVKNVLNVKELKK